MKLHLLIASIFLASSSWTVAQQSAAKADDSEPTSPSLQRILAGTKPNTELLSTLLAVRPQTPLGPEYVLQAYENDMTLIGQRMSSEFAGVERALRAGQMTRAQADYLIQQRYQVAMMQYEVLSALHDALQQDIAQSAGGPKSHEFSAGSDTAVVIGAPSSE